MKGIKLKALLVASLAFTGMMLSCQKQKEALILIPEDQGQGSHIDIPGIRIIDVKTDRFTANWKMVQDALEYEYIFNGGDTLYTRDTSLIFRDLKVDTEYILRMRALPRKESGRLASGYVSVNIVTSEVQPLDSPDVVAGSTYTSTSVMSWDIVPNAATYSWTLSYSDPGTSEETIADRGETYQNYITLKGLIENRQYFFSVIAVPEDVQNYTPSSPTKISFTPKSDGSAKLLFSNFATTSDAVSFNIFANAGQYYWYEIIPKTQYDKYGSDETYLSSITSELESKAQALIDAGTSKADAWAQILQSGSKNVVQPAFACLTYSIAIFGMDLDGKVTTAFTRKEMTTPSDLDSDGPAYKSAGDWFEQSMFLGNDPTTSIGVKRIGQSVAEVKYLLYSTSGFIKKYGSDLTQSALDMIIEYVEENGNESSEDVLAKINSASGSTGYYSNRTPGTGYTIVSLAKNETGKQILQVSSITTRSSKEENRWLTYGFRSIGSNSFIVQLKLASGIDAVSGKFLVANYDEITSKYSKADYPALVLSQGRDMTAEEVSAISAQGKVDITQNDLTSGSSYFIGFAITNSAGDVTVTTTGKLTTK